MTYNCNTAPISRYVFLSVTHFCGTRHVEFCIAAAPCDSSTSSEKGSDSVKGYGSWVVDFFFFFLGGRGEGLKVLRFALQEVLPQF